MMCISVEFRLFASSVWLLALAGTGVEGRFQIAPLRQADGEHWPENLGQRHLNTRIRLQSRCNYMRLKGGGHSPPPLTSAFATKMPGIFLASGHPG